MRSRVIFLLALVMGIITTVLFLNYTNQFAAEEVVQETIEVIKAKEVIHANDIVSAESLEVVHVPKENIHPNTITDISEVEGKYAITTIETGEIILSHRVRSQLEEQQLISRKIQDGYRAVSIGVNIVESVTNFIEPEEYVDVVFTETIDNGEEKEEVITKRIFSKVRVLAVGRKMNLPLNEETPYQEYSEVTLELKPDEANKLIHSYQTGILHLTLHPSLNPTEDQE